MTQITETAPVSKPVVRRRPTFGQIVKKIGPGLIAGASDDDPAAIGTYAIAGATYGFATLWTALFTLPMMIVTQYISARIGLVASKGLGSVLREHYPKK